MKCSNMNSKPKHDVTTQMGDLQKIIDDSREQSLTRKHNAWRDLFYGSYQKMDSSSAVMSDLYGIKKIKEDSLIRIDVKNKLKIPKESFFMNNHHDTLRFAAKLTDNTNLFMHDVSSAESAEVIFRKIKGSGLQNYKVLETATKNLKIAEYEFQKKSQTYNGAAIVSEESGIITFFEMENPTKSKMEMKAKITNFLMKNIVQD